MPDVSVTITVPDVYVNRVLNMLNFLGGSELKVGVGKRGFGPFKNYIFDIQQEGESPIAFFKRFIKSFLLTMLELVEEEETKQEQAVIDATNRLVPDVIDSGIII
jgi:hypothetical protein